MEDSLRIYTDGACSMNPGPGGWAAVYAYPIGIKQISGYEKKTTNNRMELLAVVKALQNYMDNDYDEKIKTLEIISDSAYVVNAVNQFWIRSWYKNHWMTTEGNPVKNSELWKELLRLLSEFKWIGVKIMFIKVKGHSGNTLNELVDELAKAEIEKHKN